MRRTLVLAAVLPVVMLGLGPAIAQEGHPLSGSWHGTWGPNATPVLIYMKWNAPNIEGTINPGPNAVPFKVATLDPDHWTVHFEADGKDKSGNPVHIVIDGKIDNLGSYNRTISGTWVQNSVKGDFKVTRD
jgi:hypothetical protein